MQGSQVGERLPFGLTGAQLAEVLLERLDAESVEAQEQLAQAVEAWTRRQLWGSERSESELKPARIAAMASRDRTAEGVKSAGGELASRARNLINHRRKVVRGVLRAIDAQSLRDSARKTSSRVNTSRPQPLLGELAERAEHLRSAFIADPEQLWWWANECFKQYDEVQRGTQSWSDALANNHLGEWLTFLRYLAPGMSVPDQKKEWLGKRDGFDLRFGRALQQLEAQAQSVQQDGEQPRDRTIDARRSDAAMAPRAQAPRSNYTSMFNPSDEPPLQESRQLLALTPEVVEHGLVVEDELPSPMMSAPASRPASIDMNRTAQGYAFLIDADAHGVRDLEDTAFTLSLELLDESDPTELRVRAIPGPPRQIEVVLSTLDSSKLKSARAKLHRLLGSKPGA